MNTYMDGVRDALSRAGLVRSSSPSWFTGFAIGAGIGLVSGAVAALLIAPTSGPEMRREIGWRAKRLAERTQGALKDATQTVKGKLGEAEKYHGHNEIPVG